MENKERQIKDLETRIGLSEAAVSLLHENIGEIAFTADAKKKDASLASELIKELEALDAEVISERERIGNILSAIERADEIDALRRNLMEKIRSIEKDNVSNYETIGRASYEAYKDGELPSDKYSEIFEHIVKIMLKIDDSEAERERIAEGLEDLKLFDRIKKGTRSIILQNAISGYYRQLQRQYKKAGEKICHSELVMNLEAESVENAVKPFRENLQGIEKLEKEDMKLNSETEKLKGSLEGLGARTNPVKKVNEIEKHINELYKKRKELQREAGELLSLNRKDPLAATVNIKNVFKDIDKENKTIAALKKEKKRYEAEIEIERQNREIKTLNKKINGYKEKITDYSEEADQLKEKIQAAEENIKKLEKVSNVGDGDNG